MIKVTDALTLPIMIYIYIYILKYAARGRERFRSGQRPIIKFLCRQDLTRDVPSQAPDGGQNSSFFHPARRRGRIRKPAVIVRANLDDDADDDAFPLPTIQRVKFSYLSSSFLDKTWRNSREEDEN